jgi:hypothetical protein
MLFKFLVIISDVMMWVKHYNYNVMRIGVGW